ncbi:MAG: OB-fold nucleic acid binding domain-containing protein [Propionibacteriaceae bacterium]|nr:OB-fold nucleic acid binding domain-containing protein [Propionibacteriaceae bacterium]
MAGFESLVKAIKRWGAVEPEPQPESSGEVGGSTLIAQAGDRELVTIRGSITVLEMKPRNGSPWLEAELSDGSGAITLVWMGRREIPGIRAGTDLRVRGRLSFVDGRRRLYNPWYELVA